MSEYGDLIEQTVATPINESNVCQKPSDGREHNEALRWLGIRYGIPSYTTRLKKGAIVLCLVFVKYCDITTGRNLKIWQI